MSDAFSEKFRLNTYGLPTHTIHSGVAEPVVWIFQSYFANSLGDNVPDNVSRVSSIGYTNGGVTIIVPPRNNDPVVSITGDTGISFAYTGWGATQELEAYRRITRVQNLAEFREALTFFDGASQNFAYAAAEGDQDLANASRGMASAWDADDRDAFTDAVAKLAVIATSECE